MMKTSSGLQDLRRGIYRKAKADKAWRFWGLYIHVCKWETLEAAYEMAKQNNGAPGVDGVTFEAIEEAGVAGFLQSIRWILPWLHRWPGRPSGQGVHHLGRGAGIS